MRTILTAAASALALGVLVAPAPAKAQGFSTAARLSGLINELDRLNRSRPHDEVQAAISHQIGMLRDRARELSGGPRPVGQVLSMMGEGFYALAQYNQNGRAEAPWVAGQVDHLLAEARSLLGGGGDRGDGRGRGYDGRGYDGRGYDGRGYGHASYVPAPRPAERPYPTRYVPAPAPARHGRYY